MHELVGRWERYARANKATAINRERSGDSFGARLSHVRAEVRAAAAKMLRDAADPRAAAAVMLRNAQALQQSDIPLVGFDEAAIRYTQARVWQDCARTLDPTLPIVQQRLHDD